MKVNVTITNEDIGIVLAIVDEPYASAYATTSGLALCNGQTFRGVKFSRETISDLGMVNLGEYYAEGYRDVASAGHGVLDLNDDTLAEMLANAAEIDRRIAVATEAPMTHKCVAAGCSARVAVAGGRCPVCQHDAI